MFKAFVHEGEKIIREENGSLSCKSAQQEIKESQNTSTNKQSTSASQIADSMKAACLPERGQYIMPRESWLREWVRQLRTL